jgi:DNA-binding IclR family transcriptional regulator
LEFLAERPNESFSISELSRRLDISKATCHALVGSLVAARWVMRNPRDMLVRVGPALLAASAKTVEYPNYLAELARPDMDYLAQKYAAQGMVSLAVGSEIVIIETYDSGNGPRSTRQVGQRIPLRPPNGFVYLAWGQETLVGREEFDNEACAEVMSVVRKRGFSVALELDLPASVESVLRQVQPGAPESEVESILTSLLASLRLVDYSALYIEPGKQYNVRNVSVPVLDETGNVVIVLTLMSFGSSLEGSMLLTIAADLMAAASRLTGVEIATA